MGSHHGGDVGWQSQLRLVAMGPEVLLQAVGSSLKVSLFSRFWTGMDDCRDVRVDARAEQ